MGLGRPTWAAVHPIDTGTQEVVSIGFEILLDKTGRFATLQKSVPCR
jgi:hypothetical protein